MLIGTKKEVWKYLIEAESDSKEIIFHYHIFNYLILRICFSDCQMY